MMGLPLGFAQPLILLGLLSLPVLWWLLRLIPPRPLRIEFPGGLYHVTARGNGRQSMFADDVDCRAPPQAELALHDARGRGRRIVARHGREQDAADLRRWNAARVDCPHRVSRPDSTVEERD